MFTQARWRSTACSADLGPAGLQHGERKEVVLCFSVIALLVYLWPMMNFIVHYQERSVNVYTLFTLHRKKCLAKQYALAY